MLTFHEGEIELIPASDSRLRCVACGVRLASWKVAKFGETELVPHCGWCLMYGQTQWAHENREELVYFGEYVRATALQNTGKNTYVPELDVRHRLNWKDAEHAVMGIVFTSRTLKVSFARIAWLRAHAEDLYGGAGEEEKDRGSSEDVSEATGRSAGEVEKRTSG